ncbi:uncharacterized protein ACNS7B_004855 isoform 1-T1 [Menidia menidia]
MATMKCVISKERDTGGRWGLNGVDGQSDGQTLGLRVCRPDFYWVVSHSAGWLTDVHQLHCLLPHQHSSRPHGKGKRGEERWKVSKSSTKEANPSCWNSIIIICLPVLVFLACGTTPNQHM